MQQSQQQSVSVRIDQTIPVVCENCGGQTFQEAVFLRKVSKFISATAEDGISPIPTMVCTECGKPIQELIPQALRANTTNQDDEEN